LNPNAAAHNIVSMSATGVGFLQSAILGDLNMKRLQKNRVAFQLTDDEEERICSLDKVFDDDTMYYIRAAEERRLAIKEAEVIFRNAADRNLRQGDAR
jgi:hypothetical protein